MTNFPELLALLARTYPKVCIEYLPNEKKYMVYVGGVCRKGVTCVRDTLPDALTGLMELLDKTEGSHL